MMIKEMLKDLFKVTFLLMVGGIIYCLIELAFRGRTYWSMFGIGGLCFVFCGELNEEIPWKMPLPIQMIFCGSMITAVELAAGLILNVWLGLGMWDYSNMPCNFLGQICLPFSILWCILSLAAIILDDYLRYWVFGEEKPRYSLWKWKSYES